MSIKNTSLVSTRFHDNDLEYNVNLTTEKTLDVKEPVIVLFGWGGCSDKYLAKYSQIYEEKGCTTFRCVVPPKVLFPGKYSEAKLKNVAEKIVTTLQKFEDHPLYFHCFSNGGCIVYNSVRTIMQSNATYKFQVKGCIFDSAPAKTYAPNIVAAVVNAVKGSTVTKYTYAVLVLSYMYTIASYNWVSSLARCERPSTRRFVLFESLAAEPNVCPQLFLFSKIDDVCPYESIQEFIDIRKRHGVDVSVVFWEDSGHVKHLVKFREEYVAAVINFINPNLIPFHAAAKEQESLS